MPINEMECSFLLQIVMFQEQKKVENGYRWDWDFNPLNPHDASKRHFASLRNELISLISRGFKAKIVTELF